MGISCSVEQGLYGKGAFRFNTWKKRNFHLYLPSDVHFLVLQMALTYQLDKTEKVSPKHLYLNNIPVVDDVCCCLDKT